MDAIDPNLTELQSFEARLRQFENGEDATTKEFNILAARRVKEDLQLEAKREIENEEWKKRFAERDLEEDNIRKRKRQLSRSSAGLPMGAIASPQKAAQRTRIATFQAVNRNFPSATGDHSNKAVATDSGGISLFTRPSDGRLVYLDCCFEGCSKTNFKTVRGLRMHIARAQGHDSKILFRDDDTAINRCGRPAFPSERTDTPTDDYGILHIRHKVAVPDTNQGGREHDTSLEACPDEYNKAT